MSESKSVPSVAESKHIFEAHNHIARLVKIVSATPPEAFKDWAMGEKEPYEVAKRAEDFLYAPAATEHKEPPCRVGDAVSLLVKASEYLEAVNLSPSLRGDIDAFLGSVHPLECGALATCATKQESPEYGKCCGNPAIVGTSSENYEQVCCEKFIPASPSATTHNDFAAPQDGGGLGNAQEASPHLPAVAAPSTTPPTSACQDSPTPRVDAWERDRTFPRGHGNVFNDAYFEALKLARQLERELASSASACKEKP